MQVAKKFNILSYEVAAMQHQECVVYTTGKGCSGDTKKKLFDFFLALIFKLYRLNPDCS